MKNEKLTALREKMREEGIDAYIITSADAHQSEYVPAHWRGRAWLSGFNGSNGLVVVTQSEAGLWTDGRYFIQAERQLAGSGIALFKTGEPGVPEYTQWLAEQLYDNAVLGFDGRTVSLSEFDKIQAACKRKSVTYHCDTDLLHSLWTDRPPMPGAPAYAHGPSFAGLSVSEKLAQVRACMREKDAGALLLAALDDIAWLCNLRGADIPQTPVVYAYMLVTPTDALLCIDPAKVDDALKDELRGQGLTLRAYEAAADCIRALPPDTRLLLDPAQINMLLAESAASAVTVIRDEPGVVALLKAVKNETEIKNIRAAHIKEGVVMARFLMYLDEWAADPARPPLTEADLHALLTKLRTEQPHYLEPSFDTIAAYNANAASMHYSPVKGADSEIKPSGFLLVDTGAQYLDGTTDITRTIVMGDITDEMKRDFTLVLKGHIALAATVFLKGTTGRQLDAIARVPLWAAGMNYRSGTGHGLGYCLGVHEGPQGISPRKNETALAPGMLCTNEPGVYKGGRYGIRTENVMLVKELYDNEDGVFLGFELISYCPVDLRSVDTALLSPQEMAYLNGYHQQVYDALSPYLNQKERAWLQAATRSI